MSILIKGAMPPSGCAFCHFNVDSKCALIPGCNYDETNGWQRRDDCPLVELPAHGDLIDREYAIASACSGIIRALPTTEDGEDWIRVEEVRQSLKSVPAVIPAERSDDGET